MSIFEKAQEYVTNQQKIGVIPYDIDEFEKGSIEEYKKYHQGDTLGDIVETNGKQYVRIFDGMTERFVPYEEAEKYRDKTVERFHQKQAVEFEKIIKGQLRPIV